MVNDSTLTSSIFNSQAQVTADEQQVDELTRRLRQAVSSGTLSGQAFRFCRLDSPLKSLFPMSLFTVTITLLCHSEQSGRSVIT